MELCQYFLHISPRQDYLCYLGCSSSRLPASLQHPASHSSRVQLGPAAFVDGAKISDVHSSSSLPSLCFCHVLPTSLSASCCHIRVVQSRQSAVAAGMTRTFGLPASRSTFQIVALALQCGSCDHCLGPLGSLQFYHLFLHLVVLPFQSCNKSLHSSLLIRKKCGRR
jgi:hypothetical protein